MWICWQRSVNHWQPSIASVPKGLYSFYHTFTKLCQTNITTNLLSHNWIIFSSDNQWTKRLHCKGRLSPTWPSCLGKTRWLGRKECCYRWLGFLPYKSRAVGPGVQGPFSSGYFEICLEQRVGAMRWNCAIRTPKKKDPKKISDSFGYLLDDLQSPRTPSDFQT